MGTYPRGKKKSNSNEGFQNDASSHGLDFNKDASFTDPAATVKYMVFFSSYTSSWHYGKQWSDCSDLINVCTGIWCCSWLTAEWRDKTQDEKQQIDNKPHTMKGGDKK